MRKAIEVTDSRSCLNKATPDEMLFVLLGRDPAAPFAIREWCRVRVMLGKNKSDDEQILKALQCADTMETDAALDDIVPCIQPIGLTTCGYTAKAHHRWDGSPMDHDFKSE